MPQVIPISDFRSNIESVATITDTGEVAILTQNGRPRWALVDYNEWNQAAQAQERAFAREIALTEEKERAGELSYIPSSQFEKEITSRRATR